MCHLGTCLFLELYSWQDLSSMYDHHFFASSTGNLVVDMMEVNHPPPLCLEQILIAPWVAKGELTLPDIRVSSQFSRFEMRCTRCPSVHRWRACSAAARPAARKGRVSMSPPPP